MKSIEITQLDRLPGRRLEAGDTFCFSCHSGLSCFNRCCRNLNLFLYPYDVIRLKNRLGLTSEAFLDFHADVVLRPDHFFPDVLLRMTDTEERTCPFLADAGCSVYADRPDTCRRFPVESGLLYHGRRPPEMVHFFRPPDFCEGRHESKVWTVDGWLEDQDARRYSQMTAAWADIRSLFRRDPWGVEGPSGRRAKMSFMSAYNMEGFRNFVFQSSFMKRFHIKKSDQTALKTQDRALLMLGMEWIRFSLWGIRPTIFAPKR